MNPRQPGQSSGVTATGPLCAPDTPPGQRPPKTRDPSPRLAGQGLAERRGCHGRGGGGAAAAARGRCGGGGHQRRAPQLRPAGQAERCAGRRHLPAPRRPPGVRVGAPRPPSSPCPSLAPPCLPFPSLALAALSLQGEPGGVRGAGDAGGGGAAAAPRAVRVGRERGVRVPALPLRHRAHEGRGRAGRRAAQPGAPQERG